MSAQLTLRAARLQAGDSSLGWKMGFGAPAAMHKLGIQFPLLGFLSRSALLPSDASVALESFSRAAAEPEIAVHMGADLGAGADEATTRAAIAGLGPAIELADLSFPPDDAERILGGNIYQRHVILGPMDASRAGARLEGLSVRLFQDGRTVGETSDVEANTGRIVDLIRGTADRLAALDLKLRAGEVVIAGSTIAPLFVERACTICFKLDPFAAITVHFTAGNHLRP